MIKKSNFDFRKYAFKFRNTFENHRFVGPFHITTNGRCGGMVYAAQDYYYSKRSAPPDKGLPADGTALGNFISDRQDRSMLDTWPQFVERAVNPFGWRTSEFFNWGLNEQFALMKEYIDKGSPVSLGLSSGGDINGDHQVLATGYDRRGRQKNFKIFLYDPNSTTKSILQPDYDSLRFRLTHTDGTKTFWITYFVNGNYRFVSPPADPASRVPGRDYSNQDLSGRNLEGRSFRNAKCINTLFEGANLRRTSFVAAVATKATFRGADLKSSTISRGSFRNAVFLGADMRNCTANQIVARYANFHGATVSVTKFKQADLHGANFYGANLSHCDFSNSILENANCYGANLGRAKLIAANLRGANLIGADLRYADISNADFTGAHMSGADLRGVKGKDLAIGL